VIFTSCNDWLDITPEDIVEETVLFETGNGYRNALNGVYSNISSSDMYAQEMTWGFLDVLAQYYDPYQMDRNSSYRKYARLYDYDNVEIKPILSGIWEKSYKSIANCNNIICNIEKETDDKFAMGKAEKDMIQGEALALRAFLHLDLLRLFAPAPVNDDGRTYIPYCETYPSILQGAETVSTCTEKLIRDLENARKLVAPFDTIPEHRKWFPEDIRLYAGCKSGSSSNVPDDLFYAYRGFRMSYYAITAVLARAYTYAGDLEKAYKAAEEVTLVENNGYRCFDFSNQYENAKLCYGIVFALNNRKLTEYYDVYDTGKYQYLSLEMDGLFDGEEGDVRNSFIREQGSWTKTYVSKKYLKSDKSSAADIVTSEIIPVIRLSELYYIMSEYLYSKGSTGEAIETLKKVRIARKMPSDFPEAVNSMDDFKRELLRDAKRDFIGEGQLFYMYKRFNVKPYSKMETGDFVMPIPDSEHINL